MTEADRLAAHANIAPELAAMVVIAAGRVDMTLRDFRRVTRSRAAFRERFRLVAQARQRGFSLWQIGRALNRDHSTILHAERRARETGI